MRVARQNISGCLMPMSDRLKSSPICQMRRCSFFRTFSRPVIWLRKMPTSNPATRSRCGVVAHVQRYGKPLLEKIEAGAIDPSFVITHRLPLEKAPEAYKTFRDKEDGCIKVVLKP